MGWWWRPTVDGDGRLSMAMVDCQWWRLTVNGDSWWSMVNDDSDNYGWWQWQWTVIAMDGNGENARMGIARAMATVAGNATTTPSSKHCWLQQHQSNSHNIAVVQPWHQAAHIHLVMPVTLSWCCGSGIGKNVAALQAARATAKLQMGSGIAAALASKARDGFHRTKNMKTTINQE